MKIVRANAVRSQEELLELLEKSGIECTQPTVSRDIKELGLIKTPAGYMVPEQGAAPGGLQLSLTPIESREERLRTQLAGIAVTVEQAGVLVIVRTPAASAGPVARAIDEAAFPETLGTLAGDDTIFIAAKTPAAAAKLIRRMSDAETRRPALHARRK
jgi:transcriptional regulator of arginine metabolism